MAARRSRPDWIVFCPEERENGGLTVPSSSGQREIFIKVGSDMNKNGESSSDNPRVASAHVLTKTAL